jgi:hypothetical protein
MVKRGSGRSGLSGAAMRFGLGLLVGLVGQGTGARPSAALAGLHVSWAAEEAAELPDLLVRAAEESPLSSTKLRVEVVNRGRAPAPATRLTLFYQRAGEVRRRAADVPPLLPGAAAWVTVDAGAPLAAADSLTVRADHPPAVTEGNEGNNDFSWK